MLLFLFVFPIPLHILFQLPSGSLVAHFYSDRRWDWWKYKETWDEGTCRLDKDCRSVSHSWMLVMSSNDEISFASMLNCSETERAFSLHYIKLLTFFKKTAFCILPQVLAFKWFCAFFHWTSPVSPSAKVFCFLTQD